MISVPAEAAKNSKNVTVNNMIQKGFYRHYKGNEYEVIGVAHHSETQEDMVVYRSVSNHSEMWVRSARAFEENVEVNGEMVPRFKFLSV